MNNAGNNNVLIFLQGIIFGVPSLEITEHIGLKMLRFFATFL